MMASDGLDEPQRSQVVARIEQSTWWAFLGGPMNHGIRTVIEVIPEALRDPDLEVPYRRCFFYWEEVADRSGGNDWLDLVSEIDFMPDDEFERLVEVGTVVRLR